MIVKSIKFKGHRCFKDEFVGFDEIKLINVIIGRNNVGKSHLLDFVEMSCRNELPTDYNWIFHFEAVLTEDILRSCFNSYDGDMYGNHWVEHGMAFINQPVSWDVRHGSLIDNITFSNTFDPESSFGERSTKGRIDRITKLLRSPEHTLQGKKFVRLLADRDIRPEKAMNEFALRSDGSGVTNIIRRYLNNRDLPMDVVRVGLLQALNEVFGSDGHFRELLARQNEEQTVIWELFLAEEKKGLVPLSNSGSGLKTIILVLVHLLMLPHIDKKKSDNYVFAFEELENNVHPALLRRLLKYIENYAHKHETPIFLTTHSSVTLDVFGPSKDAQFIHVSHNGDSARTTTVAAHFDQLNVISELGAKASDLLQANGIIWVEGPSDRIYINRWIELYTWDPATGEARFREGRDYQCAFYGGALLSRIEFLAPSTALSDGEMRRQQEFTNLLRVNPNIAVVCDSDRASQNDPLKDRVLRIEMELRSIRDSRHLVSQPVHSIGCGQYRDKETSIYPSAHLWVTGTRDIENYLYAEALAKATGKEDLPDPQAYASFFPKEKERGSSYLTKHLKRKTIDKIDLALRCSPHITLESMQSRFDWSAQMEKLVACIEFWNR